MAQNSIRRVDFEIPFSFFFLFLKFKLSEVTNDSTVDGKKEIDSYCVLNDTFNTDDIILNCYSNAGGVFNLDSVDGITDFNLIYIFVLINFIDHVLFFHNFKKSTSYPFN